MEEEKEDVFYINIDSPTDIHKSVLECTKTILSDLKKYEAFRRIRSQKTETLMELKTVMAEIKLLNGRLKKILPSRGLRAVTEETTPRRGKQKAAEKPIIKEKKTASGIDRLEAELDDIEKKLNDLEH